jgi:hypothetical protein
MVIFYSILNVAGISLFFLNKHCKMLRRVFLQELSPEAVKNNLPSERLQAREVQQKAAKLTGKHVPPQKKKKKKKRAQGKGGRCQ